MNKGLLSVDEALAQMLVHARPVADTEDIPTLEATGRVLASAQRLGVTKLGMVGNEQFIK